MMDKMMLRKVVVRRVLVVWGMCSVGKKFRNEDVIFVSKQVEKFKSFRVTFLANCIFSYAKM